MCACRRNSENLRDNFIFHKGITKLPPTAPCSWVAIYLIPSPPIVPGAGPCQMKWDLATGVASGLIPCDSLQCQGTSNTHLPAVQAPAGTCLCFSQASVNKSVCPHLGIHHYTCLEETGPLQLPGIWLPLCLTNNISLGRPAVLQQMIKSPWRRWRWMNLRSHYLSCSSFSISAANSAVCISSCASTALGRRWASSHSSSLSILSLHCTLNPITW